MQKKHILKILTLLIIVSIITGCGGFKRGSSRPISGVELKKGIKGLEVEFLKDSVPEMVYSGTDFLVVLDIKNEGAYDIAEGDGIISLGLDNALFSLTEWERSANVIPEFDSESDKNIAKIVINGKSISNIKGEKDLSEIKLSAKELDPQTETMTGQIFVNTCYKYKTEIGESVCIDTDPLNLKKSEKSCETRDIKLSDQGAPVAITKIETKMLPQGDNIRPQFVIYIQNKCKGQIINPAKINDACSAGPLEKDDINRLDITATLAGQPLTCKPIPLKLELKRDYVQCSLDKGLDAASANYQSVLKIKLDYGYTRTISESIEVRKNLAS